MRTKSVQSQLDSVLRGNKQGFTLAELLIVLAIIGIISAILLPNILKSKPDENKAMCITCYNSLKKVLHPIINDRTTFEDIKQVPSADGSTTHYDVSKVPLANGNNNNSLCEKIASYMVDEDDSNCDNIYKDNVNDWQPSFTTKNGVEWFITTDNINLPDKKTYRTDVYIDVNGANGDNCIYSATCQNPDRFKFTILADGSILPADEKSSAYLTSQHNWFKKNDVNSDYNTIIPNKIKSLADKIKKITE